MSGPNPMEELVDHAHKNAYLCAIQDGLDILRELNVPAEQRSVWLKKMQHMTSVRDATKFMLTKD